MTEIDTYAAQSAVREQTVTVPPGNNGLVLSLRDHSWVSLSFGDQEISTNHTTAPSLCFLVSPGIYMVRSDGVIESVSSETLQSVFSPLGQLQAPSELLLTSDAPDQHIVDGIGEIAADGTSYCTITIQKMDMSGGAVSGSEHHDELFLRATGGVIMDDKGEQRLRSLNLRSGRAAFRLVSEPSPKIVTVSVFSRDPLLSKAEIQIEFV